MSWSSCMQHTFYATCAFPALLASLSATCTFVVIADHCDHVHLHKYTALYTSKDLATFHSDPDPDKDLSATGIPGMLFITVRLHVCNARYCCRNSVRLSVCPFVCLTDAYIMTKLNEGLWTFSYHTKRQSWSWQPYNVMSEIVCAQLHNELLGRKHNTLCSRTVSLR